MLLHITAVFMLPVFASGLNPAIQVVLTDKGLQYGVHVAAGWARQKLYTLPIPDISGEISTGIGSVEYTLSDMRITNCDFQEPSVEFVQLSSSIQASLRGVSGALTGKWMAEYLFTDEGSFDVSVTDVSVSLMMELGMDGQGHLTVSTMDCFAQVGDLDIELDSSLIQELVDHYQEEIREKVEQTICPNVEKTIQNLDYHLQEMDVSVDVNQDLALDLPLIDLMVNDSTSLNLGLKGEFYSIQTHQDPPFEARPFNVSLHQDYMLSAGLSEYALNSASYGYFSAGLLQLLITDSMIPQGFPIRLNTTAMGRFIPQLPKLFPDLLMALQAYALDAPMSSLTPDLANLTARVAVKAFAIEPNSTQVPLFTLCIDSAFSAKVWIADDRVKASMMMDNLTLTLASSEIGNFTTDSMEMMMKMGMKIFVLPKLNDKLGKGIALPIIMQAQLVNPTLQIEEGYVAVFSDVEMQ